MAYLRGSPAPVTSLLLLLTLMFSFNISTGHKVKDHCWDNFLSCTIWSAEGTGTPYHSCSLRCRCMGFKLGVCKKVCDYEGYPYMCVCEGIGSSTNPPGCHANGDNQNNVDENNWRHKKIFPFWWRHLNIHVTPEIVTKTWGSLVMHQCTLCPITSRVHLRILVYRGIHNFLIFALKHRLRLLVRLAWKGQFS